MSRILSPKDAAVLASWEGGYQLKPYSDGKGFSICAGHQILASENYLFNGATVSQCNGIFGKDQKKYSDIVNSNINNVDSLPDNEYAALVFHTYNTGGSETLFKMVNDKRPKQEVFDWWTTHWLWGTLNGEPVPLNKRRKREAEYYMGTTGATFIIAENFVYRNKGWIVAATVLTGIGAGYFVWKKLK